MKLTKEQWKQLSDRIFLTLRPTQHPVAMKFIKTPEEFDAIPDIEFCQNKASTCKLIGMAAHFQGTFGLTPDHFSGYYCAMNNGCMELTQEFLDGAILYKQPTPWHHEQADAIKHIKSNLEYIPEKPYAGIVCSSLCNCNIEEPDVICLQLPTQAAFHLLACYVETDWQKLEFPFSGESNCADTWMRTMKDGKIGLSLGCRGDRWLELDADAFRRLCIVVGALDYSSSSRRSMAATRWRRTTFSTPTTRPASTSLHSDSDRTFYTSSPQNEAAAEVTRRRLCIALRAGICCGCISETLMIE